MIEDLFNDGAMPVIERLVNFTQQRQLVLANDIANLSTPGFKPSDLDTTGFQQSLRDAIDRSRTDGTPTGDAGPGGIAGGAGNDGADANDAAATSSDNQGILFHDQNNRDLERIMQHLAENTLAHSMGIEFMRDQFSTMREAISERV